MKNSLVVISSVLVLLLAGCDEPSRQPQSASGVTKATAEVKVGSDGLSTEQRNVKDRLEEDNKPGSIKHLYVISAYSGQVIIYSTVRGKVTSGGKRLTPAPLTGTCGSDCKDSYQKIPGVGLTAEVIGDDGTYGHSGDYIFWWDTKGVYHQHYNAGGQIIHVSNQPLAVKGVIINMELSKPAE